MAVGECAPPYEGWHTMQWKLPVLASTAALVTGLVGFGAVMAIPTPAVRSSAVESRRLRRRWQRLNRRVRNRETDTNRARRPVGQRHSRDVLGLAVHGVSPCASGSCDGHPHLSAMRRPGAHSPRELPEVEDAIGASIPVREAIRA